MSGVAARLQNSSDAAFAVRRMLLESERQNARWTRLCKRFLTVADDSQIWRYHRLAQAADPPQGWKLHVAATILTACDVFEKAAEFLASNSVQFKAPVSLAELGKLNSGLTFGYSQIGKFITVYPQTSDQAVWIAKELHRLTADFAAAPCVPFELRYKPESCVYYRYGAFENLELKQPDGKIVSAIKNSDGKLIPDAREKPCPDWLADPFQTAQPSRKNVEKSDSSPLKTTYKVFRALAQRGKGGVYQAIDLSREPPRFCVVKEGRKNGEVDWSGRDGFWRVRHEAEVLKTLQPTAIGAPTVFSTFEIENNFYLAAEHLAGKSLHDLIRKRRRRLSLRQILKLAVQIAKLLEQIHQSGWAWRDCKPANIIVAGDGSVRPIDFESACRIDQPDYDLWRTAEFSPSEKVWLETARSPENTDLYALGAIVYFLLTGTNYQSENKIPIRKLRRGVPAKICETVDGLLDLKAQTQSAAENAANSFADSLKFFDV